MLTFKDLADSGQYPSLNKYAALTFAVLRLAPATFSSDISKTNKQ